MSDREPARESKLNIYERFEREVRTPKRRLLVDAFLPPPEALPSTVAPPAPAAAEPPPEDRGFVQSLRGKEPPGPPDPPKPQRKRGKASPQSDRAKSLQEEIEEFMNRDGGSALAPDSDP